MHWSKSGLVADMWLLIRWEYNKKPERDLSKPNEDVLNRSKKQKIFFFFREIIILVSIDEPLSCIPRRHCMARFCPYALEAFMVQRARVRSAENERATMEIQENDDDDDGDGGRGDGDGDQ